jgi:hypothetical protein
VTIMAKRFTDTDKWKDPWFESLSHAGKLMYYYYLDNCDHAGVWKGSFKQVQFFTGTKYDKAKFLNEFEGKVIELSSGNFFMPNFIKFQYGELFECNNAHKGVIKSLIYNGIDHLEFMSGTLYNGSAKAILSRLSKKKKLEIMASDFFKCTYCGISGDDKTLVVDHILPRSEGGENNDLNLTTSCVVCNSKKSNLSVFKFIEKNNLQDKLSDAVISKMGLITRNKGLFISYLGAQDKEKDKATDKEKEKEKITADLVFESWKSLGENLNAYFLTPVQVQKLKSLGDAGIDPEQYKKAIKKLGRSKWFQSRENKRISLILSPEVIGLALQDDDPIEMDSFLSGLGLDVED